MFAIHNHITNYKITQEDLRNGFFDMPFNLVKFRFSLDKTEFDASETLFNYDVSCKIGSATIGAVNTFLEKEYGDAIDDKDSFERRDDHIWVSISLLEVIMFKYDKFSAINHLLNNDPDWQYYIRGFVYIIYLKKAKKYVFIVKGGKTDDWYGRIKNYEHDYGKENVVVVALFYVKFTSPAEQLLLNILASHYGSPLKFTKKEDNLGNEYYQMKHVETDEQAIEALNSIAYKWAEQMPPDEFLDCWMLDDVIDGLWEVIDNYYNDEEAMLDMNDELESLKKPAQYQTEALELLKKLNGNNDDMLEGEKAMISILTERSINEFVERCKPKAKVSVTRLPLEVL